VSSPSSILEISTQTWRRYILGAQGLWPGRRWHGKDGVLEAISSIEAVQIDPVNIVAPSHDIVLWGRVESYQPPHLDSLLYIERKLFDYGGNVNIFPIEERPYWRHVMQRRQAEKRWAEFAQANQELIEYVRIEVAEHGPLKKRDLAGNKVANYRAGKDSGVALYYLWLTGELMSHSREGRERVYDLADRVAPEQVGATIVEEEAQDYLFFKEIAQLGLAPERLAVLHYRYAHDPKIKVAEARKALHGYLKDGRIAQVVIEGEKGAFWLPAARMTDLEQVHAGGFPDAWQPLASTTKKEVVLLSPLDYVSARGRAAEHFNFEYIWEIYKKVEQRLYGPYTMPVLFGDRLVGRLDARMDRDNRQLVVNGLWFEEWFKPDRQFRQAFTRGLANFLAFLEIESVDTRSIRTAESANYF
jgi:hypothetical protein